MIWCLRFIVGVASITYDVDVFFSVPSFYFVFCTRTYAFLVFGGVFCSCLSYFLLYYFLSSLEEKVVVFIGLDGTMEV